jgi:prevent-host-death family protein
MSSMNWATEWPQEGYVVATMDRMDRMGIRDLKLHASAVIRRVTAGETIEITDYGHPVARLVPLRGGRLDQLVAEGRATEPRADLLELMDELGLPLGSQAGGPLPSEVLAELRADER